jgi:ABC-2 type transport system ATP-binding protein
VLHQGKVLAHGEVARVVADAGAQDVNAAFARLTAAVADTRSAAP